MEARYYCTNDGCEVKEISILFEPALDCNPDEFVGNATITIVDASKKCPGCGGALLTWLVGQLKNPTGIR